MLTLNQILEQDARVRADTLLPPEAYRFALAGAVRTFKEASIRDAFPLEVLDVGPGAIKSRAIKLVDGAAAEHGMKGTSSNFDRVDYAIDDQPFYPIFKNVEVPMREQEASKLGGMGLDILRDSAENAGALIVEGENTLLISGLGPVQGLTALAGQTFAGGSWQTAGNAWKDIIKALGKLRTKKVPGGFDALLVNPTDWANLMQTFSNTSVAQIETIRALFPGGVKMNTNVTAGKAYVYAKTPTVLKARIAQNLTVIPLPKLDEDDRMRVRVIPTLHVFRADGICEVTGVT